MNPVVNITRAKSKTKVPGKLVTALNRDRKRFQTDIEHIAYIGINYRTYTNVLNMRMARPDVIEKIEIYLSSVA